MILQSWNYQILIPKSFLQGWIWDHQFIDQWCEKWQHWVGLKERYFQTWQPSMPCRFWVMYTRMVTTGRVCSRNCFRSSSQINAERSCQSFFCFFFGGGQPTAHITCSQDTHKMLLNLSVPVLGWLDALDNGEGRQGARFLDFSPIARHHESNQSNLFDMFDGKLENTSAWCCPMHCSGGEWDIWMIRATQMAWATKPCSMPLTSQFLTRKTSKKMHDKFHSQKWVYIIAFTAGVAGL